MFKRVGVLAMILAGSLAVLQPSVAQARERDDYRYNDRHEDRRDWNRREFRDRREDRNYRAHEWRERERWQRRDYRNNYYSPYVYAPYYSPYCPR
jgi:hypothetical protein